MSSAKVGLVAVTWHCLAVFGLRFRRRPRILWKVLGIENWVLGVGCLATPKTNDILQAATYVRKLNIYVCKPIGSLAVCMHS